MTVGDARCERADREREHHRDRDVAYEREPSPRERDAEHDDRPRGGGQVPDAPQRFEDVGERAHRVGDRGVARIPERGDDAGRHQQQARHGCERDVGRAASDGVVRARCEERDARDARVTLVTAVEPLDGRDRVFGADGRRSLLHPRGLSHGERNAASPDAGDRAPKGVR
jgi:hypothetical protein